ncbi:sensor histidine kinase [Arthrobacter cheniae]|uniref:histidine kinase n=1 Tax=Arthrobacter cheniae TaxID=1258888 RepID=A0A3A5M8H8_9MICC|nr:histidine kinase [Arthrobacter cheniae]RJT77824.1 sensor histidine kinase [Arthrobacter cheniae]
MIDRPLVKDTAEKTAAVSFTELNARRLGPIRRFFRRHPRAMDIVVILAFLFLALPSAVILIVEQGKWLGLTGVVISATALVFRRDHPLLVLAVVAVLDIPMSILTEGTGSSGIATMFALYAVAVTYPLRTALFAAAAASTLSVASLFLIPPEAYEETPGVIWLLSGFVVMFLAVAVGVGVTVRRDREHESEMREWAARNAELASAGERNRIAREMHDVVAHSLTVMVALSDGAAVVMKRDPDRASAVLGELSRTGRAAIADMRRVLGVLRAEAAGGSLEPLPASSSLTQLLDGFRAAGLPLRVTTSGPRLPDDPAFQLTVYRILQESLTNVLKYGKGVTLVDISIARAGHAVSLRVADDGRGVMGPVVSLGSGQGIAGMRERAAIYGGEVECGVRPSGGWIVEVQLTVPDADGGAGNQRGNEKDDHAAQHGGHTHQGSAR